MTYNKISIRYNNISTINLTKSLIQHSSSKYIKIKYYFVRNHIQNNDVILEFVSTDNQIIDIFIKPLGEDKVCSIKKS